MVWFNSHSDITDIHTEGGLKGEDGKSKKSTKTGKDREIFFFGGGGSVLSLHLM